MHSLRSLSNTAVVLAASIALVAASLTEHPINECYDHEFSTYNASATVNFAPLSQNVTNSSLATWKLSTAVKEVINNQDDNSVVKQKWWLEGDTDLSATASPLPIEGCIILLQATPNNTFHGKGVNNSTSQNGCSRIMTPECQSAMTSLVSASITSMASTELDSHWTICPQIAHLLYDPPKECQANYHLDAVPLQIFGNAEFIAPSENGCNSSTDFDIFEGSAIRNSFLELPSPPTAIGDHKIYDEIVEATNPFLLVSWPRNRTQAWYPDAQIACLTPVEGVVTGSRVPGSKEASAGTKNAAPIAHQGESLFALWILLLIVSLVL